VKASTLAPLPPTISHQGEAVTVPPRPATDLANDQTPAEPLLLAQAESRNNRDIIPGYEILEELGRGGMGVVYKALQIRLHRVVALKMILAGEHAGEQDVSRFRGEAESVARLQHPHIVQIYEVGEADGRPFFSLEYVDGGSLADYLDGTPLPAAQAAAMVETLADAMQYAHDNDIVHRDLKPANILMASGGRKAPRARRKSRSRHEVLADLTPKITDFGLAKRLDVEAGRTQTGAILGTPSYMAPEQAGGAPKLIGRPADVYALGAILYELLTGRPPFKAATPLDTILQVVGTEPVAPRQLQPRLSRDLETVCLKCLQKEPRKRYPRAGALADDLHRFLDGQPVRARPVGAVERLWRLCRRNPVVAGLTTLVTLLILAVAVGATITAFHLHEAAETERSLRADAVAARQSAEDKAAESRRRLVRLNVTTGNQYMEQGDLMGSLPWFTEALRQAQGKASQQEAHRVRLAAIKQQCPRLVKLWAHNMPVTYVEFSRDGRHVLAVSAGENRGWSVEEGELQVWDARTGKEAYPRTKENGFVTHAAFAPDSLRFVTTNGDRFNRGGAARVREVGKPGTVCGPMKHRLDVVFACFGPNGKRLVTASAPAFGQGGEVRVWKADTGEPVIPPIAHALKVFRAVFSPNGRHIVTASGSLALMAGIQGERGEVRVWDAATGKAVTPPMVHAGSALWAEFSRDGRLVVSASKDGSARIWDARTGKPVAGRLLHDQAVVCARFSYDGRRVVTASSDRTARVWDVGTGRPVTLPLRHNGPVRHAEFSPDGQRVVTAGGEEFADEGEARVWDPATGKPVTPWLKHTGRVNWATFSPDGRHVLSAGADKAVRMWDLTSQGISVRSLDSKAGTRVAQTPDGRLVALRLNAAGGTMAQVWDMLLKRSVTPRLEHPMPLNLASLSDDGRRMATVCMRTGPGKIDSEVRIWETAGGRPMAAPIRLPQAVSGIKISPNGGFMAVMLANREARLYNIAGHTPVDVPLGLGKTISFVAFSQDSRYLLTVTPELLPMKGSQVEILDLASGRALLPFPLRHDYVVEGAAFSMDGRRLLTASNHREMGDPIGVGKAYLWDLKGGEMMIPPLPHRSALTQVAFSPDPESKYILTASADRTARVWTLRGKPITPPLRHSGAVSHARFSPNGRYVLTTSGRTARVWQTTSGDPVTPPLEHPWPIHDATFQSDGSPLIASPTSVNEPAGVIWLWNLRADMRSIDILAHRAQLLAGRRIDATGGFVPVEVNALAAEFAKLPLQ
jgi:WD40 repeat protein